MVSSDMLGIGDGKDENKTYLEEVTYLPVIQFINKMCLKSSTLLVLRGLNSIIHAESFELCLTSGDY